MKDLPVVIETRFPQRVLSVKENSEISGRKNGLPGIKIESRQCRIYSCLNRAAASFRWAGMSIFCGQRVLQSPHPMQFEARSCSRMAL